jgi:hypothetical protein
MVSFACELEPTCAFCSSVVAYSHKVPAVYVMSVERVEPTPEHRESGTRGDAIAP